MHIDQGVHSGISLRKTSIGKDRYSEKLVTSQQLEYGMQIK